MWEQVQINKEDCPLKLTSVLKQQCYILHNASLYSIRDSVKYLKALLRHLDVWQFQLYGQLYGGILAFENPKSITTARNCPDDNDNEDNNDNNNAPACLSANSRRP
jgi:hypothetical protein